MAQVMNARTRKALIAASEDLLTLFEKDYEGKLCLRWFSDKEITKKANRLRDIINTIKKTSHNDLA